MLALPLQVIPLGTKVGIVMQYLPNGSLRSLLLHARLLTFTQAAQALPPAEDCCLPALPDSVLTQTIASFVTMPVLPRPDSDPLQQWVRPLLGSAA